MDIVAKVAELSRGARTIFPSGPMSGYPNYNRATFNAFTASLRAKGFVVHNPAEYPLDPEALSDALGALGFAILPNRMMDEDVLWRAYLLLNEAAISRCHAIGELLRLPGWEDSRGARIENALAEYYGWKIEDISDAAAEHFALLAARDEQDGPNS